MQTRLTFGSQNLRWGHRTSDYPLVSFDKGEGQSTTISWHPTIPIRASTSTNSTWFLRIGWTMDELLEPGQWHCMQRCDPQNVDTQSQRNKAYCNNNEYNTLYTCERNKTCSIESTIFCIWILGFFANCLEIQSNQPRDFLPPYHTFPPHRWEITTSLQTDAIKCVGQILTSAKAPSTQNLGHEDFAGIYEQCYTFKPSTHPFCLEQSQRWRQRGRCHIANIQHLPILPGLFRTFSIFLYLFLVVGYSRWLCQFAGPCPGDLPRGNNMSLSSPGSTSGKEWLCSYFGHQKTSIWNNAPCTRFSSAFCTTSQNVFCCWFFLPCHL